MNPTIEREASVIPLKVTGDLISTTATRLQVEAVNALAKLEQATEKGTIIRIDLTAAKMVDSVGLNLITLVLKGAQKRGARIQLVCSNPNVIRTFIFTRLDKHAEVIKG